VGKISPGVRGIT